MISSTRYRCPLERLAPAFIRLFLCTVVVLSAPCSSSAQIEAGIWGGIGYTTLAYTQEAGPAYGAGITYHLLPHFSAQLTGGVLLNAFNVVSCELLPPASEQTFHARMIPVELWLRFRTSGDAEAGSFNLLGGVTGTSVRRDAVTITCGPSGQRSIPELSVFTLGAAAGVGFETPRFIAGRGRIFGDYYFSWGISGLDDDGDRIFHSSLRVGTSFAL